MNVTMTESVPEIVVPAPVRTYTIELTEAEAVMMRQAETFLSAQDFGDAYDPTAFREAKTLLSAIDEALDKARADYRSVVL